MKRPSESLPASYFEELYGRDPDPWGFERWDYERDKYAATLAALPRERYGSALEVGCSIGVLTLALSARCDRLLSLDAAEAPLAAARARLDGRPGVTLRRARVPEEWPAEAADGFDLIVLSEVLYYFSRDDLADVAARAVASLRPGGDAVLVHWLPEAPYPLGGDEAVEGFLDAAGAALRPVLARREPLYRLDVLRRA